MVLSYTSVNCTTSNITLTSAVDTVFVNVPQQTDPVYIYFPTITQDGQIFLVVRYDNTTTPVFVYPGTGNTILSYAEPQYVGSAQTYQYTSIGTNWMNPFVCGNNF
jgi:hypothetical protein